MGLPRYLKDKVNKFDSWTPEEYIKFGYCLPDLKVYLDYNGGVSERYGWGKSIFDFSINELIECGFIKAIKYMFGYPKSITSDPNRCISDKDGRCKCDKLKLQWFKYWEKIDNTWTIIYHEIEIPRHLFDTAFDLSENKKDFEMNLIRKKEELDRIKNCEQGRLFSGRLRQMIFERDNYKCVLCGKGVSDGVSIEVDHIIEWVDGGRTIYDNGQTLCSDCNKGKHLIKDYHKKIKDFKSAARTAAVQ